MERWVQVGYNIRNGLGGDIIIQHISIPSEVVFSTMSNLRDFQSNLKKSILVSLEQDPNKKMSIGFLFPRKITVCRGLGLFRGKLASFNI